MRVALKINPYTIKKESMWVNVDEAKYVNDALFSDIRKNFASKITPSSASLLRFDVSHADVRF